MSVIIPFASYMGEFNVFYHHSNLTNFTFILKTNLTNITNVGKTLASISLLSYMCYIEQDG